MKWQSHSRTAFTLIELLIVVGIITLLLQMILPAVEMSREAARQTQCTNHIRQLALAIQTHEGVHQRLPSGGWTAKWVGEPERGTDVDQPGSWMFNVLDYLDQGPALRSMGAGLKGADREQAIRKRCQTPLPVFYCPSRRLPRTFPQMGYRVMWTANGSVTFKGKNQFSAKSDYVANSGGIYGAATFWGLGWTGPENLEEGDNPEFVWPTDPTFRDRKGNRVRFDGLIYGRSNLRLEQITDGLSKTYLTGEKNVRGNKFVSGKDGGDNEHLYAGFGRDSCRTSFDLPKPDSAFVKSDRFGSAHPSTFNMAFADGSVHQISYDIDLKIHQSLGSRDDGVVIDVSEIETISH